MPDEMTNPFINNTPSSSPVKQKSLNSNRISKRPMSSSSSSSSLLSSPVRRPRSSVNNNFTDRFIPNRTDMDLNTVLSIGSTSNLPTLAPSSSDNQLEFQRERQAHQTFDTILKNELFGEKLVGDAEGEDSIDRIKYTAGNQQQSLNEPTTPPRRRESVIERDAVSAPATPRRLTFDDYEKPSSNSFRGASLLTYRERTGTRPSTASLIQSQYLSSISPVRPDSKRLLLSPGKKFREIAKVPYRVLDAPSLADDFYFDLVDWSSTDVLGVVLGKSVFLTDNATNEVVQLCDTENEYTSINWVGAGSHLAVGQGNGLVEIYDIVKRKCIRTLSGHMDRVACLSWNNHILTSGSRDRKILHRDVRMPEPYFEQVETHTQEVCGLKWNTDENRLASGGNDNVVYVYDGTSRKPTLKLAEHTAAVKAIAWSPHKRGILATGGGTADKKMKIWNVNTSTKLRDIDTGSQVCNMIWSKNTNEIVTSHGYSKYNLTLWDYPSMEPVAILKGHSFRVLHLTLSADGTTVVSGAGDETLRYWKLFDRPKPKTQPGSALLNAFNQLR